MGRPGARPPPPGNGRVARERGGGGGRWPRGAEPEVAAAAAARFSPRPRRRARLRRSCCWFPVPWPHCPGHGSPRGAARGGGLRGWAWGTAGGRGSAGEEGEHRCLQCYSFQTNHLAGEGRGGERERERSERAALPPLPDLPGEAGSRQEGEGDGLSHRPCGPLWAAPRPASGQRGLSPERECKLQRSTCGSTKGVRAAVGVAVLGGKNVNLASLRMAPGWPQLSSGACLKGAPLNVGVPRVQNCCGGGRAAPPQRQPVLPECQNPSLPALIQELTRHD